ncbi:hypothetical protein STCU_11647 [Strigomonas culicis]|uniref:Uncharacterized protein n=1 Tax=Strigomonas culicis TaxID=28005 RepID=S9UZH3_9TRYP|nr:hypothetical protein STCU_11647 [Strigomonas culicis]|eukprot:EPY15955.1 hypothetical protein STCU_11647 [Strigomonas culicis]
MIHQCSDLSSLTFALICLYDLDSVYVEYASFIDSFFFLICFCVFLFLSILPSHVFYFCFTFFFFETFYTILFFVFFSFQS